MSENEWAIILFAGYVTIVFGTLFVCGFRYTRGTIKEEAVSASMLTAIIGGWFWPFAIIAAPFAVVVGGIGWAVWQLGKKLATTPPAHDKGEPKP